MAAELLTDEQISDFKDAFDSFDADFDGQISTQELSGVLSTLGQHPSEAELQDMVKKHLKSNIFFNNLF